LYSIQTSTEIGRPIRQIDIKGGNKMPKKKEPEQSENQRKRDEERKGRVKYLKNLTHDELVEAAFGKIPVIYDIRPFHLLMESLRRFNKASSRIGIVVMILTGVLVILTVAMLWKMFLE